MRYLGLLSLIGFWLSVTSAYAKVTMLPCGRPYQPLALCLAAGRSQGDRVTTDPEIEVDGCVQNFECQVGQTCYAHAGRAGLEATLRRTGALKGDERLELSTLLGNHKNFLENLKNYDSGVTDMSQAKILGEQRQTASPEEASDWGYIEGAVLPSLRNGSVAASSSSSYRNISTADLGYWTTRSKDSWQAMDRLMVEREEVQGGPPSLLTPLPDNFAISKMQTSFADSKARDLDAIMQKMKTQEERYKRAVEEWHQTRDLHEKNCQNRRRKTLEQILDYVCRAIPLMLRVPQESTLSKQGKDYLAIGGGWHFASVVGVVEDPRPDRKGQLAIKLQDSASPDKVSYVPLDQLCYVDGVDAVVAKGDPNYEKSIRFQNASWTLPSVEHR